MSTIMVWKIDFNCHFFCKRSIKLGFDTIGDLVQCKETKENTKCKAKKQAVLRDQIIIP